MGVAAKNQQTTNLKSTVTDFKRFLGRQFRDPLVKQELENGLPFDVIEQTDGSIAIKVRYQNEEQMLSPEQVTATLFTKLRETADIAIGAKTVDCVISVSPQLFPRKDPSNFTSGFSRPLVTSRMQNGVPCWMQHQLLV
jgi:molecular chaperone DnaK (HSP70)